VEIARKAGARKVYFASAAPPITGPDPYGIDLPTKDELIAADHSIEDIRNFIGADALFYGTIESLRKAVRTGNKSIRHFSEGCFTGQYPTPEVTPELLRELGGCRNHTREAYVSESTDEEGENYKMMSLV
jgi:amidophosphoribosyltransferase